MAGVSVRRSPATVLGGMVKVSCTASPACCAAKSVTATGTGGDGGVGSPGAPQPPASNRMKNEKRISKCKIRCRRILRASGFREFRVSIFEFRILKDVAAQVLVLDDIGELFVHVGSIDLDVFLFQVGGFKGKLVEHFFQNGVQAAGANIFGLLVDAGGEFGDGGHGILGDVELHSFRLKQRHVLFDQGVLWLRQNAHKIFFLERLQLHADGQAALQLGDQVRRLADVEGAGGDKQNMVGANHAVAGVHRGAFDDGQNVALHTFAGDIRSVAGFASGDFVDLVDKDDAHLLGALDGGARDLVHVEQLVFLFLNQVLEGVGDAHLALLFLLPKHAGKHVLDVDVHLLDALIGDDFKRGHGAFAHFNIDHALIELAFAELCAQFFARALRLLALLHKLGFTGALRGRRRGRQEEVKDALFCGLLGAIRDFIELFLAHHVNRGFHQVAHHGLDVAANVADLRVLGGFDLYERAAGQAGQAARDFRFADAGRADHENIFGQNVFGDFGRKFLAAHAVAQSYSDGTLRGVLPDDVLVQLRDDFARSHVVERGKKVLGFLRRGTIASRDRHNFFFRLAWHESFCSSLQDGSTSPSYLRYELNAFNTHDFGGRVVN